jgi:tRNA dimethylallyltransferase
MFDAGLLDEVKVLQKMGYNRNMTSIQGIGYKEVFDYFDGKYTLDELKDIIKQNSRRYAKRQLTWFRKDERVYWFNADEYENRSDMSENILKYIEGKLKLV